MQPFLPHSARDKLQEVHAMQVKSFIMYVFLKMYKAVYVMHIIYVHCRASLILVMQGQLASTSISVTYTVGMEKVGGTVQLWEILLTLGKAIKCSECIHTKKVMIVTMVHV